MLWRYYELGQCVKDRRRRHLECNTKEQIDNNELVLFAYSEEKIEQILVSDLNSFECEEGIYTITSEISNEISKREKSFPLQVLKFNHCTKERNVHFGSDVVHYMLLY